MSEEEFKMAVANILEGQAEPSDTKVVKNWLKSLNKKEGQFKRQLENNKNNFLKEKNKIQGHLDEVRKEIKEAKKILGLSVDY